MIASGQDPDVVRWSLQLFECNPYSDINYCNTVTPSGIECYNQSCFKEDGEGFECKSMHDGKLLDSSLGEELSELVVSEVNVPSNGMQNHVLDSVYQQEWDDKRLLDNYNPVVENGCLGEMVDMADYSSGSCPRGVSCCTEEWSYPVDLTEVYSFNGEVGKRLNQMLSVPHTPKINGEIPSFDDATLDHQRLLDRLRLYDLLEHKVKGDGNCQFRALSDQFYRTFEHHEFVRRQIVNQLKMCRDTYQGYVPMAYEDYVEKMSKCGEWGDHVTLQAASDSYGIKIFVITSFRDTCYIEILPNIQRSKRVICLSFWAEVHYNSVYPQGDLPDLDTKKKRRWRVFRNKIKVSDQE